MKNFLIIFFSQFLIYALVIINTRSYTNDQYFLTGLSDVIFASINFFLIKKIAKDDSMLGFIAYVLGGLIGSLVSMYVSKEYLAI